MGEQAALVPVPSEVYMPPIVPAPALQQEKWTQARFTRWMGDVALQGACLQEQVEPGFVNELPRASLQESVARIQAGEHSPEDVAMARENARTALSEELYKAGHITEVSAQIDADGSSRQHSQSYDSIYRNALEQPQTPLMQRINTTFARNWHRQEDLARSGILQDHYLVTFALAPHTAQEVLENNFFATTLALSIQVHTMDKTPDGTAFVKTNTAFVAGMPPLKEDPTLTEEERLQQLQVAMQGRHDLRAVQQILTEWGVADASRMGMEEILDLPICVPKSLMQNGVTDIVELYDQKVGTDVFFGSSELPRQSYQAQAQLCAEREKNLETSVDAILQELISQNRPNATRSETTKLLSEIVFAHAFAHALKNNDIDVRNFNIEAQQFIVSARTDWARGNMEGFLRNAAMGASVAYSLVCNMRTEGSSNTVFKTLAKALGVGEEALDDPNDRSNWQKHRGKCRMEECRFHETETWVGPCDVCDDCQEKFDKGAFKE